MAALHRPRRPARLESRRHLDLDHGTVLDGVEIDGEGDDLVDASCLDLEDVELVESVFRAVRFTGSTFERWTVTDCRFERCDLSGLVGEEAVLSRVEFVDCRMSGAVLATARLRHVRFEGCRLDAINLRMASATPVALHGCQLPEADLYGADLTGAELLDCDLRRVDVSQATLTGARLHGSDLTDLTGGEALRGVEIDAGQVPVVALALLAPFGIRVTER